MPENENNMPEEQKAQGAESGSEKPRGGRGDRGERGGRGRGGRGGRKDREEREESPFIETLIDVYRCSATVKGGRRLSFGALFTVGNGKGKVGIGYGKAKEVPAAIQKAMKKGRTEMVSFPIVGDGTIPHRIVGRFGASEVILIPALPGTGVIASASVKAVLEAGGLKNILTKSVGSNNTRNVVKAVINALSQLRSKELVEKLRGISVA
ncbi:MAG: 30S ribosomal protein S5 [Planctomycetes bacterium]|nr:30S ribosomal protein S5 [Planctomycetota bacterium]